MLNYKFEDKDIASICEKYGISKREFESTQDEVGTFYSDVRVQHLSSIMRCLEIKGRHITNNKSFRIDWDEMKNDSPDAHSMWQDGRFIILLPKDIAHDEARYIVAHELGHLFYVLEMLKTIKEKNFSTQDEHKMLKEECKKHEIKAELHRKSNLFGIVLIQERSYFYNTKVPSMLPMINRPVEDIIKNFT